MKNALIVAMLAMVLVSSVGFAQENGNGEEIGLLEQASGWLSTASPALILVLGIVLIIAASFAKIIGIVLIIFALIRLALMLLG